MDMIKASEAIDSQRRRFFGTAALSLAAAQLGLVGVAGAQSSDTKSPTPPRPGTNTSFASLKQIDAGVLNVGYAEDRPANGPAVILLHGWPYDIHSFVDVAPLLASAGYPTFQARPSRSRGALVSMVLPDRARARRA
jgi:hypothetical protein